MAGVRRALSPCAWGWAGCWGVWNEARLRNADPSLRRCKPLVFAGMTGADRDLRFDKSTAGFNGNRFVQF
jgi:hypothetical protein